jgi:peptide/nickel transport system substrate-binding protein
VVRPRGGVARLIAPASFSFDTFDAQRAGETSVLEILGRTHSRLLNWDVAGGTLVGDLAQSWEQPDGQTLLVRLQPGARWHDRPPVNGRPFAAADVVAHLRRGLSLGAAGKLPNVQRAGDLLSIQSVDATDSLVVRIDTAKPDPFLLATLAARFAVVQAAEAVQAFESEWVKLKPAQVIGTGPFQCDSRDDSTISFTSHTGGHRVPLLDGIELHAPAGDDADRFVTKSVDEVILRDRRDGPRVRSAIGAQVQELSLFEDSPVISTVFVGSKPWNNPDLRRALSGALNRAELGERLFGGRARPSAPVLPVFPGFQPAGTFTGPGYEDFAAGAADARRRWQAAGGPGLGTITIDFPTIFDPVYSASSIVTGMLNEVLGNQFHAAVDTYTNISAKTLGHRYGNGAAAFWFGWGPPLTEPDPSRSLIETYSSRGRGFATTGFKDADIDAALDKLAQEFDLGRRKAIAADVTSKLIALGGGGVFDWLVQLQEVFRWPYLDGRTPFPWPEQWRDAASSLDPSRSGFTGRP